MGKDLELGKRDPNPDFLVECFYSTGGGDSILLSVVDSKDNRVSFSRGCEASLPLVPEDETVAWQQADNGSDHCLLFVDSSEPSSLGSGTRWYLRANGSALSGDRITCNFAFSIASTDGTAPLTRGEFVSAGNHFDDLIKGWCTNPPSSPTGSSTATEPTTSGADATASSQSCPEIALPYDRTATKVQAVSISCGQASDIIRESQELMSDSPLPPTFTVGDFGCTSTRPDQPPVRYSCTSGAKVTTWEIGV